MIRVYRQLRDTWSIMKSLVIVAALGVLVGGGIAAAQAPQRAQPVKPGKCRRARKSPRCRRAAPTCRRGRHGATPILPDLTPTATRAASRSSGRTSSPAAARGHHAGGARQAGAAAAASRPSSATPALSEFPGATSPMHWFENYNAANSRAWLVVDPPDGKVPPQTAEAQQRAARAQQAARRAAGRPTRGRTAASTIAASRAACPAR